MRFRGRLTRQERTERRAEKYAAHNIGTHGPVGAMRIARDDETVIRTGLVAMRLGFSTDIVAQGLDAYYNKEASIWN